MLTFDLDDLPMGQAGSKVQDRPCPWSLGVISWFLLAFFISPDIILQNLHTKVKNTFSFLASIFPIYVYMPHQNTLLIDPCYPFNETGLSFCVLYFMNLILLYVLQTELISGDQNGNIRVWDLRANSCSCELVCNLVFINSYILWSFGLWSLGTEMMVGAVIHEWISG